MPADDVYSSNAVHPEYGRRRLTRHDTKDSAYWAAQFGSARAPHWAASAKRRVADDTLGNHGTHCAVFDTAVEVTGSVADLNALVASGNLRVRPGKDYAGSFVMEVYAEDPELLASATTAIHTIVQEVPDVPRLRNMCRFKSGIDFCATRYVVREEGYMKMKKAGVGILWDNRGNFSLQLCLKTVLLCTEIFPSVGVWCRMQGKRPWTGLAFSIPGQVSALFCTTPSQFSFSFEPFPV